MSNGAVLRKSNDAWIAGVCGGIANFIGWEAGEVRVTWVIVGIFSGGFPGLTLYFCLWLFMPDAAAFEGARSSRHGLSDTDDELHSGRNADGSQITTQFTR